MGDEIDNIQRRYFTSLLIWRILINSLLGTIVAIFSWIILWQNILGRGVESSTTRLNINIYLSDLFLRSSYALSLLKY